MLNQVILDMSTQLIEAKKQVAVSIADEKKLAKQAEQQGRDAAEWERRAMLAVKAGDDGLAKEALQRKKELDALYATLNGQWQKQKAAVDQLKTALRMLNDEIEEAKRKRGVLVARMKAAEAQKAIRETMSGMTQSSAFETFDRMAQRVDRIEAEAEASWESPRSIRAMPWRSGSGSSSRRPGPTTNCWRSSERWASYRRKRRSPRRCPPASKRHPQGRAKPSPKPIATNYRPPSPSSRSRSDGRAPVEAVTP